MPWPSRRPALRSSWPDARVGVEALRMRVGRANPCQVRSAECWAVPFDEAIADGRMVVPTKTSSM